MRSGQESATWPTALLLLAVLVPAVCLLWFMGAAMRNERLAARQKLADAYRSQVASSQKRLEQCWQDKIAELEVIVNTASAPAVFAKCVLSGAVDSVIVFDDQGQVIYPNHATGSTNDFGGLQSKWAEANQHEYFRTNLLAAAKLYDAIGREATNVHLAARAFQAEARCLARAGKKENAIKVISETLGQNRFSRAADAQGRLIVANAELMALELTGDRTSTNFGMLAQRLRERIADYGNPALAAPQRRFLMKELRRLSQDAPLPTLAAEELAAEFCDRHLAPVTDTGLQRTSVADVWQFATPDRRVLGLIRSDKLIASFRHILATETLPADTELALLPPGMDGDRHFVSILAGGRMPGWRLGLSLKNPQAFDITTKHRTAIYFWTGIFVVAVVAVLSFVGLRVVRRQVVLARLKNDLAATVSHELKTPLASMRVLVDTLLDSEKFDQQTVREYLQLIRHENERLTRVIQNFLSFSRMEAKKQAFAFSAVPVRQIVDAAVASMGHRLDAPGCRFEAQVEPNLPPVMADGDALVTAVTNLLDNAWKYSEDIKHIILSVRAENGGVLFSVKDNGIGIAPREARRIFQPFYQVDQSLTRKADGCGLGLSIIQFIVAVHRGKVAVQSEPGRGSIFTIVVPAVVGAEAAREELKHRVPVAPSA